MRHTMRVLFCVARYVCVRFWDTCWWGGMSSPSFQMHMMWQITQAYGIASSLVAQVLVARPAIVN